MLFLIGSLELHILCGLKLDLPTFETKEKKRQWILQSDDEESEDEY